LDSPTSTGFFFSSGGGKKKKNKVSSKFYWDWKPTGRLCHF